MANILEQIEKHIKTHTEHSAEDSAAVSVLRTFLRSGGKINTDFSVGDKWPNTDGTFEFVQNPEVSRRPEQNFIVQIKGTHKFKEDEKGIKYVLKSLAFPAYIYKEVSLDPGILFVILNPDVRGNERVFWKYMSVDFIHSIDYGKDSVTLEFSFENEIKNTDESIDAFCCKLMEIAERHTFIKEMDKREYDEADAIKIVKSCDAYITESISRFNIYNETRDDISKRIYNNLHKLCFAVLILNAIKCGKNKVTIALAWEQSLLNIKTKYLGVFFKGLSYIGNRIPDDGQFERLLLKYYDFLWRIRGFFKEWYNMSILQNLEKFPHDIEDRQDKEYYNQVAKAFDEIDISPIALRTTRYYIQKKTIFFVGQERYYEITLQLAGIYSTKYNRITAYTKEDISTDYSIQIAYVETNIDLWDIKSKIKIITNWQVSVEPESLNDLAKVLQLNLKNISSTQGEYISFMKFLTRTGINLLELIDLKEIKFSEVIEGIFAKVNTFKLKEIVLFLHKNYSENSKIDGSNVIRYLLINLREETFERVMPNKFTKRMLCEHLYLSSKCRPFERNPYISNLAGSVTVHSGINHIIDVTGVETFVKMRPYVTLENIIKKTGEIYFDKNLVSSSSIEKYNNCLDNWEADQGFQIKTEQDYIYIDSYEQSTLAILQQLLQMSKQYNAGQKEFNENFIRKSNIDFSDKLKEQALKNCFVNSRLMIIYGAAGTGKTMLMNYISNLMGGYRKLFLTKTHAALKNLERRIDNPGTGYEFVSIDSFTKKVNLSSFDVVFVDECSTIDNRTMLRLLEKMDKDSLLVLAGDIYQIESIDFGNWFYYAKDIIKTFGANIELLSTWRTEDKSLISLWNEVRNCKPIVTEKLVIDGPFSEDIGPNIFKNADDDEVVLCLNYDGKFGLNNINKYFQNINTQGEAVNWQEWTYKVGDRVLFNDSKRFPILYNNLKGVIADIKKETNKIAFTVDVYTIIPERICSANGIEYIGNNSEKTRIKFVIYENDGGTTEEEQKESKLNSIVPFQLAYAVSIHKAQGLEYNSVKIVIPSSTAEKITHSIFYTAITRAKKKLKIYWSTEVMNQVIKSFNDEQTKCSSMEIIKSKLGVNN